MTQQATELRSVVVERDLAFPCDRVWRALTQPHLIAEWLMRNDFAPVLGQRFTLSGDWGSVECEVLEIEPEQRLVYRWGAMGLDSTVTWTLAPTATGTHLRMEQAGFRPDQDQAFHGARLGWRRFLGALDDLLARID
jgi:uncharacterized protein YndB with AHSA1/START domain